MPGFHVAVGLWRLQEQTYVAVSTRAQRVDAMEVYVRRGNEGSIFWESPWHYCCTFGEILAMRGIPSYFDLETVGYACMGNKAECAMREWMDSFGKMWILMLDHVAMVVSGGGAS